MIVAVGNFLNGMEYSWAWFIIVLSKVLVNVFLVVTVWRGSYPIFLELELLTGTCAFSLVLLLVFLPNSFSGGYASRSKISYSLMHFITGLG